METVKRCVKGTHTLGEIRCHLALLAVGYWMPVYLAWRGYMAERPYSIMTHTLSALGSFDVNHNPRNFWLFSVAMIYCGVAMIPVILYIRRRFAVISEIGARIGSFLFIVGCIAIILTGVFPDAQGKVVGGWEWRHIHIKTAVTIAFGFGLGVIWHWVLILRDMISRGTLAKSGKLPYLKLLGPFTVTLPVFIAIGYRMHWKYLFGTLQAAFHLSMEEMNTYWNLVQQDFRFYPLLEHLSIWGLTIFVIWFAAVMPREERQYGRS